MATKNPNIAVEVFVVWAGFKRNTVKPHKTTKSFNIKGFDIVLIEYTCLNGVF